MTLSSVLSKYYSDSDVPEFHGDLINSSDYAKYMQEMDLIGKGPKKWLLFNYPSEFGAKQAMQDYASYEDLYLNAVEMANKDFAEGIDTSIFVKELKINKKAKIIIPYNVLISKSTKAK